MMGQAVKQFFEERGVKEFRLTLMPLEGEGTIEHRVDKSATLALCHTMS